MTQKKLTELTELSATAAGDYVYVVDVSDTSEDAGGSSRKAKLSNLLPDSGVTANSYGGAAAVPVITVNAKGQVTAITTAALGTAATHNATDFATAAQGTKADAALPASSAAAVATSGSYNDLLNKPTLGSAAALAAGSANGVATLDGGGKVPVAQIPTGIATGLQYQGTWNAGTNSPSLTSGTGTKGFLYKVSVAGTTALDGIGQWNVGDEAFFDGTAWNKFDGLASEVVSVAGRTGNVTLTASDIAGVGRALSGATVTMGDGINHITAASGGTTANLPASPVAWKRYTAKDAGFSCTSNPITFVPPGGQVEGQASVVMNARDGMAWDFYHDGTNWFIA